MALPHFGIMQEVRVCDSCFTKLNRKSTKIHRPSQSVSSSRHRSARDLADAELQRAIQLSLEEVGAAGGRRPGYVPSPSPWQSSEPPIVDHMTHPYASSSRSEEEEEDPDLKAAIEASLREANAPKASAPVVIEPSPDRSSSAYVSAPVIPNYDLEPLEADAILTFNQTVDQVQAQGGKDIARYPAVTELFDKANSLRPKLAMNLSDTGRKEQLLSEMHDKLSQAVKLYDQLLTEQVSHPPWRSASVAASTSYQQVNPTYAARYQTVDGSYNQWSPEVQSQHPTSPVIQGQMQAVQSYYAASQQANGPYVTSPVVESYHQPIYQPQQVSIPPSRYPTDIQQQYPPESTQYAMTSPPPVTVPRYNAAPAAPQPAAIHLSSITPAPVSLPTASIPPPPQSQPQPNLSLRLLSHPLRCSPSTPRPLH
ncbi:Vacuolar protein sorting-associated protein 27 [Grifola frondosa]|uniref:Vacuolar protein sorting-associated protein 27 n=1 Tax=Grifola frondosa TaxID=5627 RepID=A0A1C7MR96_GRIFR|nr:Vacuolar protein sorting-associated protein 27 [Grifola frondosa]